MKRCPECRRDYYDESMRFCLDDGSELLEGPASIDEPATAILSESDATATLSRRESGPSASPTVRLQPPGSTGDTAPFTKSRKRGVIVALTLFLLIGAAGLVIYKFSGNPGESPISFQTAKFTRLTTTGKASGVAISPDGKYVVHVHDDGGQQSLWMRQIATQSNLQIVAPAIVDYSTSLSFSPDGNYIYYSFSSQEFPKRALFEIPTLGGTPKKLLEHVAASPVSFSPDGRQFAFIRTDPGRESAIMIANSDGTAERSLLVSNQPAEVILSAAWSPDGKRISYGLRTGDTNDTSIFEVEIADSSTRALTERRWVWANRINWLADGSGLLMQAPPGQQLNLQLWHLSYPGGEPQALTNDLNNYQSLSLTADSSMIAVVQSQTQASIWTAPVASPDRGRPITSGTGKADSYLGWTPDGRIVYTSNAAGNSDIWIMDADGARAKQLTSDTRADQIPEVSPDGRFIVFLSDRSGVPHLWRMNIDGSDQRQLANTPGGEQGARFSPDGRWLVYRTSIGRWTTWKIPAEGGEPVQITDRVSRSPAVSPDGKLVAYFYRDEDGPWRIAIAPFEGGEPSRTYDIPAIPDPSLRWTPDGRAIAYITTVNGVSNLVAQPIEGGPTKQLTDFKDMRLFSFDYSRDGKQLALSRGTVSSDVVLISDFRGVDK